MRECGWVSWGDWAGAGGSGEGGRRRRTQARTSFVIVLTCSWRVNVPAPGLSLAMLDCLRVCWGGREEAVCVQELAQGKQRRRRL